MLAGGILSALDVRIGLSLVDAHRAMVLDETDPDLGSVRTGQPDPDAPRVHGRERGHRGRQSDHEGHQAQLEPHPAGYPLHDRALAELPDPRPRASVDQGGPRRGAGDITLNAKDQFSCVVVDTLDSHDSPASVNA